MKNIIFATGNKDKMREIREIMADCDVQIQSMKEAGIQVDIVEDGKTFEENALIKARAIAAHTDAIVLADDSGLEIDALNKEPGVYSARYMGEDTSYDIKNQNGLDYQRLTIYGQMEDLYHLLMINKEGREVSDDEFFPELTFYHIERGVNFLYSEYLYADDRDKFFKKLVDL